MSDSEAKISRGIQVEATRLGARLWRNNTGLFYTAYGSPTKCGLCVGSADLIGITHDGVFLAVEVKAAKGRATKEQLQFLKIVRDMGGVGILAHSVDEFKQSMELERLSRKLRGRAKDTE